MGPKLAAVLTILAACACCVLAATAAARRTRRLIARAVFCAGVLALPATAGAVDFPKDETVPVAALGVAVADHADVTPDAHWVAFTSSLPLDPADQDQSTLVPDDVFRKDFVSGAIELVDKPLSGPFGVSAIQPSISDDGRLVAFTSADSFGILDGAWNDVFVRDMQTRSFRLVSRASGTCPPTNFECGAPADHTSSSPDLARDGRYVAFLSDATNLSDDDAAGTFDVFVRDLQTAETTLASRVSATDGGAGADASSGPPSISADGRYIAFASDATNLSSDDAVGFSDVFVRDVQDQTTALVSRAAAGRPNSESFAPAISADGRFVAFVSRATNLGPDVSASPNAHVYVRDLQQGTTELVDRRSAVDGGAVADTSSDDPAISTDGNVVAFSSPATNLSADDMGYVTDVFIRRRDTATTILGSRMSASAGGGAASDDSEWPVLSADGRYLVFASAADNLSTLDDDSQVNLFLRDFVGPPPLPPTGAATSTTDTSTTTADTSTTTTATTIKPAPPLAPRFSDLVRLPNNRRCVRSLRIAIRPGGRTLHAVRIRVNRRTVRTLHTVRRTTTVTLRRLPRPRARIGVVLTLQNGSHLGGHRTYRVCG
jgi:Tol biopolymer transport system component